VKAETDGSFPRIACQDNPNQVYTKPHRVCDTPALNPSGGVVENGHGLVNANCTIKFKVLIRCSNIAPHSLASPCNCFPWVGIVIETFTAEHVTNQSHSELDSLTRTLSFPVHLNPCLICQTLHPIASIWHTASKKRQTS